MDDAEKKRLFVDKEERERRERLRSLVSSIIGEGFEVPKDLEERAGDYDTYRKRVAESTGRYHFEDISVYSNLVHYMGVVIESLVRMPFVGLSSSSGRSELKKFIRESYKKDKLTKEDGKILTQKYINYRSTSHRRSDKRISAHKTLVKLFLNHDFLKLYERGFGKGK